jgi:hypothetical protein
MDYFKPMFAAVGCGCDVCHSTAAILAFLENQFLKLGPFHRPGIAGRIYLPLPLAYARASRLLSRNPKPKGDPIEIDKIAKRGPEISP